MFERITALSSQLFDSADGCRSLYLAPLIIGMGMWTHPFGRNSWSHDGQETQVRLYKILFWDFFCLFFKWSWWRRFYSAQKNGRVPILSSLWSCSLLYWKNPTWWVLCNCKRWCWHRETRLRQIMRVQRVSKFLIVPKWRILHWYNVILLHEPINYPAIFFSFFILELVQIVGFLPFTVEIVLL